ncbi:hypothetical protein BCR32DRAFT_269644 [Anaeromyces robustus]|uniref:Autophagy-related protein 101 n=1 Tax=Anaeromyces robustus TaxID=1754192 RepID=A0A1Y1X0A5_9FUNG|nr:hypothetical protein BCR32DRAFT_269644 [Anaeromyces robustus]|eukprot:ORX79122.1 hypothetical protein BCR32DRAFT_269644 [Anaeromyces robustus]
MDKQFQLRIESDYTSLAEVVKSVLHTIFFHRIMTLVSPVEVQLGYGVQYVKVDDSEIEEIINQKTLQFIHLETFKVNKVAEERIEIRFEKQNFLKNICWEQWNLDFIVKRKADNKQKLLENLEDILIKISQYANTHKDHIPQLTSQEKNFPYEVNINSNGWNKKLKRMWSNSQFKE